MFDDFDLDIQKTGTSEDFEAFVCSSHRTWTCLTNECGSSVGVSCAIDSICHCDSRINCW